MATALQVVNDIQTTCAARLGRRSGLVLRMTNGLSADPRYSWCGDYVQWYVREFHPTWPKATPGLGRQISSLYEAVLRNGGRPYKIRERGNRRCDVVLLDRARGGHVGFLWSVDLADNTFSTMDGNSIGGTTNYNERGGVDWGSALVLRLDDIVKTEVRLNGPLEDQRKELTPDSYHLLDAPWNANGMIDAPDLLSALSVTPTTMSRMLSVSFDG